MRLTTAALILAAVTIAAPLRGQDTPLGEARRQLAAGHYAEAAAAYRRCLDLAPADTTVLAELSTALDAAGRWREAVPYVRRLTELAQPTAQRLTQLARYEAWSGARQQARADFARAFALDSTSTDLLASYGEFLSWSPRTHARAAELLRRALRASPHDPASLKALAQLELERGRYVDAADLLAALPAGVDGPTAAADSITRATRALSELGALSGRRSKQLNVDGAGFRAVVPSGYSRFAMDADGFRYRDQAGAFSAGRARVSFADDRPGVASWQGALGMRTIDGAPAAIWDGRLAGELRAGSVLRLSASADRAPVEETRRSFIGETDGVVRGAVHANSRRAGVSVAAGAMNVRVEGIAASYRGYNIDANERKGLEAEADVVLRRFAPWLRVGYDYRTQRFEHNAFDAVSDPARYGGYFSPRSDHVGMGVLQVSHWLAPRLLLEVDARGGREKVQMDSARAVDSRTAAVVYSHLAWRVSHQVDLDAAWIYVNVFTAFRQNEAHLAIRRYY
jgi:Tfp pilus assembly protein PilF